MHTLERDTLYHGTTHVHVEKEVVYDSTDGMRTVIPYNSDWKKLLIQASGGLDSTLMLYLTLKTFKELNSKVFIQPFSMEIPTKAKNLSSVRAVLQKVRELIDYEYLLPGLEVQMPMDHTEKGKKDRFFNDTIVNLFETDAVSFEFNGDTKNPSEEARRFFPNDEFREFKRDHRTTIYNATISASPHAFNDKKGIVFLYKKEGVLDELAPLTISCDINLAEAERRHLSIPCDHCWWCYERRWGFTSNGITNEEFEQKYKGHFVDR